MSIANDEANKLREEAINLLNGLVGINPPFSSQSVERFVDCVIMASMLKVADMQTETIKALAETK